MGVLVIVATPPIRLRILKALVFSRLAGELQCCNASDPTEDTERRVAQYKTLGFILVATPPIRLRILKGYITAYAHVQHGETPATWWNLTK